MVNPGEKRRYDRTVERMASEAYWLVTHQTALIELDKVTSPGIDFFHVARIGLLGDRLVRLVRVFEQDTEVASFWYLFRCNPNAVKAAIAGAGGSVKSLEELSEKLKLIRNKAFVHIDKQGVQDPQSIYNRAKIVNKDVDRAIRVLWDTANTLYQAVFGKPFPHTAYKGDDIGGVERLRGTARVS